MGIFDENMSVLCKKQHICTYDRQYFPGTGPLRIPPNAPPKWRCCTAPDYGFRWFVRRVSGREVIHCCSRRTRGVTRVYRNFCVIESLTLCHLKHVSRLAWGIFDLTNLDSDSVNALGKRVHVATAITSCDVVVTENQVRIISVLLLSAHIRVNVW